MDLKVGDEIMVRVPLYKWNGGDGNVYLMGKVVSLDSERIKVILPNGKEEDIPWWKIGDIEILEAKKSISQKAFGIGVMVISFIAGAIVTVVGLVVLGIFFVGLWIRGRFKKEAKND